MPDEDICKMEHRYDPRIDIQKRVLIHVRGNTFVSGATRDISHGGLCLESAGTWNLQKNAVVRAAFVVNGQLVILRSQVLRVDEESVALMFIEEQASPRKWSLNAMLDDAVRAQAPNSTAKA
jgi:c-di-GMP-binding flagellar brake protein YcgR